jgi:glucan phosphoethanolaminetransferase (alkaline phosphatase superfamily)
MSNNTSDNSNKVYRQKINSENVFLDNSETDNQYKPSAKHISSYENYVIIQNETLHKDNRRLNDLIKDLEFRISELEDDESRSERRVSNMKGLLQNFHAMNKTRQTLQEKQDDVITQTIQDKNLYLKKAIRHIRIMESVLLCFITFCYEYYDIELFLPILSFSLCITAFQESLIHNFPKFNYTIEKMFIKNVKEEIKETEKGQDYIHQFLDEQ